MKPNKNDQSEVPNCKYKAVVDGDNHTKRTKKQQLNQLKTPPPQKKEDTLTFSHDVLTFNFCPTATYFTLFLFSIDMHSYYEIVLINNLLIGMQSAVVML